MKLCGEGYEGSNKMPAVGMASHKKAYMSPNRSTENRLVVVSISRRKKTQFFKSLEKKSGNFLKAWYNDRRQAKAMMEKVKQNIS